MITITNEIPERGGQIRFVVVCEFCLQIYLHESWVIYLGFRFIREFISNLSKEGLSGRVKLHLILVIFISLCNVLWNPRKQNYFNMYMLVAFACINTKTIRIQKNQSRLHLENCIPGKRQLHLPMILKIRK